MSAPAVPNNFYIQQGNGDVFLSWDISAGASSYDVQRSTDGVSFSSLVTPATNYYLDSSVTVGILYYYQIASINSGGTSPTTSSQSIVPTLSAQLSLGQVRVMAQQRADRLGSNFIRLPEWNTYINQSYFELYDLLVTTYEDYYVTTPYTITTDGISLQYTLPTNFYKLIGVDLGLSSSGNAWVSIRKFDFPTRNSSLYPQLLSRNPDLKYRLVGNTIMFSPAPASGQFLRIWYIPRLTQLLQDTDILDGISGWSEYVIVDAAIKALQKEESDVSVLGAQKMMLIKRIEETAMNRDAGMPDTISDVRSSISYYGYGDGFYGGF